MIRRRLAVLALLAPVAASAQNAAIKKAVGTITEADVRRRIEIIAHDSMGGRDTPSEGLDKTAAWVAGEFKRIGLKPGGDQGAYIQRYEVNLTSPDPDSSFFQFISPAGKLLKLQLGADVMIQGTAPRALSTSDLVVIAAGASLDTARLNTDLIRDKIALLVFDWSHGMAPGLQAAAVAVVSRGARGVLLPVNSDSMAGMIGLGMPRGPQVRLGPPRPSNGGGGRFFGLTAERRLADGLPDLAAAIVTARATATTTVTALPGWRVDAVGKMGDAKSVMAPNTVGILEGTDPVLKNEYVVVSAHMDHVGGACSGSTPADRICNGADDDGSGTVGVVGLAEAFMLARPRRSVIFVTVSGEEKGLWGSAYFAGHMPVETRSVVADLNMDMIGRNWKDTVVAIGKEHSDLGATANRVTVDHPDLGIRIVDDLWPQENLYFRSDHYNFARKGIPVLFFTSGLHADYHAVTDSPDKIDAEKEARILRLVFYLGQEVANADGRPSWNPESYKKIVSKENQVP